jgi:hypothetical protein
VSDTVMSLLPFTLWLILSVIPCVRLLKRTGIHISVAAFNLIPLLGTIILLWIVAYSRWPIDQESKR